MQIDKKKIRKFLRSHRRVGLHLALMFFLTNFVGILLGSVYGTLPYHDIPVVVISHDDSASAESFVKFISDSPTFDVTFGTEDALAEEMIFNGDAEAAVIIPEDFSDNLLNGTEAKVMLIEDGAMSPVASQINSTVNSAMSALRNGYLIKVVEGKFNMPAESAKRALFPFGMSTQILGNPTSNTAYMTVEGILLTMVQIGCFCVGIVIHENKNVKKFIAKGLIVSAFGAFTGYTAIFVQYHFFHIPYFGSRMAGFLIIGLMSFGVTFLGIGINRMTKGHILDKIPLASLFSLMMLFSGYVYPISAMPAFFRGMCWFLPSTHSIIPFRDLALTGYSMSDVMGHILWLVGFAALMFIVSLHAFRKAARIGTNTSENDFDERTGNSAHRRKKESRLLKLLAKAFPFRKGGLKHE